MLTPGRKGAIAETSFAAHATRLGFDVYRPVAEGGRYDLILDLRTRLIRVQCKWGRRTGGVISVNLHTFRRTKDGYARTVYTAAEVDAIGVYCAALDRCYLLPISLLDGRRGVHLRVDPSRNNQRALVNWAHEYELGAIAQLGERLNGIQEVVGSSPTSSTSEATAPAVASLFDEPANSSKPLRAGRRLPIIRSRCDPWASSAASS